MQIKEFERQSDELKKEEISKIFDNNVQELKELINLDMIFDSKYLNKGNELDKIEKDIIDKFNKIRTDLKVIKELNSKHELSLNSQYLKTFDLGQVIIENQRLNNLEIATVKVEIKQEEIKQDKIKEIVNTKVEVKEENINKTYDLRITGTIEQHKKLKEFLELNEMETINIITGNKII
jgi:hypothetical protein